MPGSYRNSVLGVKSPGDPIASAMPFHRAPACEPIPVRELRGGSRGPNPSRAFENCILNSLVENTFYIILLVTDIKAHPKAI
jgi:hypothetical protein